MLEDPLSFVLPPMMTIEWAILDGMIVRVGVEHDIIPITSVLDALRPKPEEVRHVEGRSDVIHVRGEFLSVIHLHRAFNISGAHTDPGQALVVLVESHQQKRALVVDELMGQQQVDRQCRRAFLGANHEHKRNSQING